MEISILISVLLLEILEVVQLVLEADNLILELDDFSLAIYELSFLILEVIGLCVDQLIEVINPGELLRNFILKLSCLSSELG